MARSHPTIIVLGLERSWLTLLVRAKKVTHELLLSADGMDISA
jgi:hypothetical protein